MMTVEEIAAEVRALRDVVAQRVVGQETVIEQGFALPLVQASSPYWVAYASELLDDAQRVIWLLRLNYVRLRRQRLSPDAAAASALLREHEDALGELAPSMATVLQRTQARAPRPLPPVA